MNNESEEPAEPQRERVAGSPDDSQQVAVSSPAATGGAGTFFEQHVDAYWLAQLLVSATPPIFTDSTVIQVDLQTEHLGWNTDDFLVTVRDSSHKCHKLIGQVKRKVTVGVSDEDFKKVVSDWWDDFNNKSLFLPGTDRLVLATLRGTNALLEHFTGLLDCAKAASSADDFERRLAIPGFVNNKTVDYCKVIQQLVGQLVGEARSASSIWAFLKAIDVLVLDLHTSTSQSEASIRSLLAYTTKDADPVATAGATWNQLLTIASQGMATARSFKLGDLPEALTSRHGGIGTAENALLTTLRDHSNVILDGIRSTIGTDLHLPRAALVQRVMGELTANQIVLISGAAGSGKSVVTKDVMATLSREHFIFCFRAEEFKSTHLDTTLRSIGVNVSAAALGATMASQTSKVLLVESIERLLEASTRDGFSDLLTLIAKDKSWRLVLTCREYSTDLVRTGLLGASAHTVMAIPQLGDDELTEVELAYPALKRPMADPALRRLLRNPYVLDKALRINWASTSALPQDERGFRDRFWRDIVRVDHQTGNGMPRKREQVFMEIAVRRARALALYAPCGDLDPAVLEHLRSDSLVAGPSHSQILVAPAHDVLEDWAILQWVEEQYLSSHESLQVLATALGTYPAIRRTYRKWIGELLESSDRASNQVFESVIRGAGYTPQFVDDTLVALLHSPKSSEFLANHKAELFDDEFKLLFRVIHLLRVGCVTTPWWVQATGSKASLFAIPDGPAWASVLKLVADNLDAFGENHRVQLLGFIEDWTRGASFDTPYPPGHESVAAVAFWILEGVAGNYLWGDQQKKVFEVIARIPKSAEDKFTQLLEGTREDEDRDRVSEEFQQLIYTGSEGWPAGRDLPATIARTMPKYLLYSEEEITSVRHDMYDHELEGLFGIKHGRTHGFFPASAYHGPLFLLLRADGRVGLKLVIDMINHCTEWYANPRVEHEFIELPERIRLEFSDGSHVEQWCNGRLWGAYRGLHVSSYVFQSILMAFERWLLEYAEQYPRQLDKLLLGILKRSTSGAITAVIAGVATSRPHDCGETLLVLLKSPACMSLDRSRMAGESQTTHMYGLFGDGMIPSNRVYEDERKASNALPHRQKDLEDAIANLQLGPLRTRVHAILDEQLSSFRPVAEQSEEDRVRRLALHRMDLRQYTLSEERVEITGADDDAKGHQGSYVKLEPKAPDVDIQEVIDRNQAKQNSNNRRMKLFMWGKKAYDHELDLSEKSSQWQTMLDEARQLESGTGEYDVLMRDGWRGYVAAVCTRDYWNEMTSPQKDWCREVICAEVERESDNWDETARVQRFAMGGDRPSAWAVSRLRTYELTDEQLSQVTRALAAAITHPVFEVKWFAVVGVSNNLWARSPDLADRCVRALATEALKLDEAIEAARATRTFGAMDYPKISVAVADHVRQGFIGDTLSADAYQRLNIGKGHGADANAQILAIYNYDPNTEAAVAAYLRTARTLVDWWDADDNKKGRHRERGTEAESQNKDMLFQYVIRATVKNASTVMAPIIEAVDRHPDEIQWVLSGLLSAADRVTNVGAYWDVWRLFADRIEKSRWITHIDDRYTTGANTLFALFQVTKWKEGVRHWHGLDGHESLVPELFTRLVPSATALEAFSDFLYYIGEKALPGAFVRIAEKIAAGDASHMLRKGNTRFLLEVVLQQFVYGRPAKLKRDPVLRNAVMRILDSLVDNGSSAAFRMRDDFVTPMIAQ
ncbi:MAG TPA: AAA family ATPase [Gammaproteobacteria bacterium]|nr:AAA family ATPase [Gammaproteobacteria bacterium]